MKLERQSPSFTEDTQMLPMPEMWNIFQGNFQAMSGVSLGKVKCSISYGAIEMKRPNEAPMTPAVQDPRHRATYLMFDLLGFEIHLI